MSSQGKKKTIDPIVLFSQFVDDVNNLELHAGSLNFFRTSGTYAKYGSGSCVDGESWDSMWWEEGSYEIFHDEESGKYELVKNMERSKNLDKKNMFENENDNKWVDCKKREVCEFPSLRALQKVLFQNYYFEIKPVETELNFVGYKCYQNEELKTLEEEITGFVSIFPNGKFAGRFIQEIHEKEGKTSARFVHGEGHYEAKKLNVLHDRGDNRFKWVFNKKSWDVKQVEEPKDFEKVEYENGFQDSDLWKLLLFHLKSGSHSRYVKLRLSKENISGEKFLKSNEGLLKLHQNYKKTIGAEKRLEFENFLKKKNDENISKIAKEKNDENINKDEVLLDLSWL